MRIAEGLGRQWDITLEHLERVKWYAPHIRHVVLDVRCSATPAPAEPSPQDAHQAGQVLGNSQNNCPMHPHGLFHPIGLRNRSQELSWNLMSRHESLP